MRISDCADLTGTTVRTIRYYHQIGLLPVPEGGLRRDYDLEHIARILRIRWLAEAGLSLETIADLLAAEGEATPEPGDPAPNPDAGSLRDLYATAAGLEDRIAELRMQQQKIAALIAMAEEGRALTALPPAVSLFYDRIARKVSDPATLKVLQRERRLAELFAQRGLVPKRADALITTLGDGDMDVIVDFYARYAQLGRLPADEIGPEIESLVDAMVGWCADNLELTRAFLDLLPGWARTPRAMTRLVNFSVLVCSDGRQAEVIRRAVPAAVELVDHADETKGSLR